MGSLTMSVLSKHFSTVLCPRGKLAAKRLKIMVLCGADELYTDGPRSKAQKLLERCLQLEEFP